MAGKRFDSHLWTAPAIGWLQGSEVSACRIARRIILSKRWICVFPKSWSQEKKELVALTAEGPLYLHWPVLGS
jgi:hypothetical protein